MRSYEFCSNSPAATLALGKRVGGKLSAGGVLALTGELGCGKTLITRGICAGLDVPLRQVNSPTFVLVNEYQGRLPVFHMDMYQLGAAADAVELGMMDYLARARAGVMIIEWAERIRPLLPPDILKIELDIISAQKRHIVFRSTGGQFANLLKELNRK
jgi:tRNA threonylcarbamoyladenosine biosynthesis protein TsaE